MPVARCACAIAACEVNMVERVRALVACNGLRSGEVVVRPDVRGSGPETHRHHRPTYTYTARVQHI